MCIHHLCYMSLRVLVYLVLLIPLDLLYIFHHIVKVFCNSQVYYFHLFFTYRTILRQIIDLYPCHRDPPFFALI